MRFFNKYFFTGMVAGVVLTIIVFFVGVEIYFRIMSSDEGKTASMLVPPHFPEGSKLSVYDQTDYHWSLRTLDGKSVSLSEFKNNVVFINLWATWCGPCIAEMPGIQSLYDSLKNERITFLLISDEGEATVRKLLHEKGFTFPVYLRGNELPNVFRTLGIPATFILNRDGSVVFKEVGASKWDDESCRNFIRSLM